jgi:hypothetical protein
LTIFSKKYCKNTITDLPAVDYGFYNDLYALTQRRPKLTDKEIAVHLFKGACGKKEIDRIKQTKLRLRHLLG